MSENAFGDIKVEGGTFYRWDGGAWMEMVLYPAGVWVKGPEVTQPIYDSTDQRTFKRRYTDAEELPQYAVRMPGVWYVARGMSALWHGEHGDTLSTGQMGKEEREVAKALLRCALERLEEMED